MLVGEVYGNNFPSVTFEKGWLRKGQRCPQQQRSEKRKNSSGETAARWSSRGEHPNVKNGAVSWAGLKGYRKKEEVEEGKARGSNYKGRIYHGSASLTLLLLQESKGKEGI